MSSPHQAYQLFGRQRRRDTPACWGWPALDSCTFASEEEAESFLQWWHNGLCAICGYPTLDRPMYDHDHKTGLVRGYLCRECNAGEGRAGPEQEPYARYRQRNPASILGIEIVYYSPWTGYAEPEPELEESLEDRRRRHKAAVDRLSLPKLTKEPTP